MYFHFYLVKATKTYFYPYNDIKIPGIINKFQRDEYNQS